MNLFFKLFFLYCSLFSITTTLIHLHQLEPTTLPATLLFFPVTLYFTAKLAKGIKNKALLDPESTLTFNGTLPTHKDMLVVSITLLVLIGLSLTNISAQSQSLSTPTSSTPTSATASATPQAPASPTLGAILIDSPSLGFAVIRQQATHSAQIITRAKHGSAFPIIRQIPNWIQIQIDPQTQGWINKESVKILPNSQ